MMLRQCRMREKVKIERLTFQVNPPEYTKDFLMSDSEVWNPWLKRQPGFLNKTSRLVGNGLVELTIFWKSGEGLKGAEAKTQEREMVEAMMRQRFPGTYTLVMSSVQG